MGGAEGRSDPGVTGERASPATIDSQTQPGSPFPKGAAILVSASLFMEMLDGTILATALPSMARELGVPAVRLQLVMTAYLVAVAVCIPASGWLARRFDARRLFTAALALFTLASLACALSQGLAELVVARTFQGVAGAMMMPVGRLLILRDLPKDRLVHAIALLTWPALLAPAIAPPLGGLIVEYASWRWIFVLNLPLGLAGIALARRLLPALAAEATGRFDLPGLALWAVTAVLLVGVAADLPRLDRIPALAAVAATILFVGLLWRHLRRARHPLLELDLLADRNFGHTLLGGSLVRIAIFANPFLLPLMLQIGMGMSAIEAAMLLLVGTLGNLGMKPLTTPILQRFSYRAILLANGTLLSVGLALFAVVDAKAPQAVWAGLLMVTGMARSMHFTALNTLAFTTVPLARMTAANALFSTTLQLNAALGVAAGALALQLWPELAGGAGGDPLSPFRFAFAVVAVLAFLGTLDALRIDAREPARLEGEPT